MLADSQRDHHWHPTRRAVDPAILVGFHSASVLNKTILQVPKVHLANAERV